MEIEVTVNLPDDDQHDYVFRGELTDKPAEEWVRLAAVAVKMLHPNATSVVMVWTAV